MFELTGWQLLAMIGTLISVVAGVMVGLGTMIIGQINRNLDHRMESMEQLWDERYENRVARIDAGIRHQESLHQGLVDRVGRLEQTVTDMADAQVDRSEFLTQVGALNIKLERLSRRVFEHLKSTESNANG